MASIADDVEANEGDILVSGLTEYIDAGQPPCRLLNLPAELRNRIYECTLCEGSKIEITAALQQPALLSTCKTIRYEALNIWYLRNAFFIRVYDCDTTLRLAFEWHLERLDLDGEGRVNLYTVLIRPNWDNLMHWCYLIWNNELPYLFLEDSSKKWTTVLEAAHGIVAAGGGNESWEVRKAQLQQLRKVAGLVDPRWLE